MKFGSRDELADYLVRKWDYNPARALSNADQLLNIEPAIHVAFEQWLENGEFPETPVYFGYSPKSLNKLVDLKPPAIFMLLDWIRREPHEATRAMRRDLIDREKKPS